MRVSKKPRTEIRVPHLLSRMNSFTHLYAKHNSPRVTVTPFETPWVLPPVGFRPAKKRNTVHLAVTSSLMNVSSPMTERSTVVSSEPKSWLLESLDTSAEKYFNCEGTREITVGSGLAWRYEVLKVYNETEMLAKDHKDQQEVLVKVHKSGALEAKILRKLEGVQGVQLAKDKFEQGGKQFIVFEQAHSTLAEKVGGAIASSWVKSVCYSIVKCLEQVHKSQIIHCDLSPTNLLISSSDIAISGFGAACFLYDKTLPLQFSSYKAPELILGCPFNTAVDMWSFGCILAELVLGKPLFEGTSDKSLLESIFSLLGRPPSSLLRQASRRTYFFSENDGVFTLKSHKKIPYSSALRQVSDFQTVPFLLDLLEICLDLNPVTRLTATEAMNHPFFTTVRAHTRLPQLTRGRGQKRSTVNPRYFTSC